MSEKLKVLKPIKPVVLNYSFRDLDTMDKQGKLDFNLPIQRELKWQDNKAHNDKSLLICSLLVGEQIGMMKCNLKDGVYSFTDGKQRANAVFSFMRGEYVLKYLPLIQDEFTDELYDLNGKRFQDLPANLQEKITSYKPMIFFTENATEAQQAYSFKATNNGMPLTNAEKARVECKDQESIVILAQHELLPVALTTKQIKNRDDESIIKNIWGIFNIENVSFLDKIFTPQIQNVTFTDDQKAQITNVLDRLLGCYKVLKKRADKESDKKLKAKKKRFLKKVFKKGHIPTMSLVIQKSIEDGVTASQVSEWMLHFFGTDKGSSISEEYNKASMGGSASAQAVKTRMDEAMQDYVQFIKDAPAASQSDSETLQETEELQGQIELGKVESETKKPKNGHKKK